MDVMDRCRLLISLCVTLWIATGLVATAPVFSQTTPEKHNIDDIIRAIDELYRSRSSYAEVEMEIVTPNWQRTLELKMWTEGMEKTFIRIMAPRKEKGLGTLRIGNEMWNYLPRTNKVMKIPPSMIMGSWMGSDFTNDDLVSEISYLEDYVYEYTTVDAPQPRQIYIKATPRDGVPVVWGYLVMSIREQDYLPVEERYYDEKGRLMRTMVFSDIRRFGSKILPAVMELIPANKEGHRTIVRYEKAEFDVPLEGDIFSLRNLRSQ